MPTLDGCINATFEPGAIGSSSGTTPTVIEPGSLLDPVTYDPESVLYSLDYSKFYNSMYLILLIVGGGGGATIVDWPNALTTGVPDGVTLVATASFTTSSDGQIVDGLDMSAGTLIIDNANVTVQNCRIGQLFGNATGTNLILQDCDFIGIPTWNSAVTILGDGASVLRCDISGAERGLFIDSDNSLIEDNYFHDLINNTGTGDPHIDGIQIPGLNVGALVSNVIIRHNNIDCDPAISSAITMRDAQNVDILNNRLIGGTYIIYFEQTTAGCDVIDNYFGAYTFGYVNGTAAAAQTYTDNKTLDASPLALP